MAAMRITTQFRLLDLPNELIIRVAQQIDSLTTLARLACTNRHAQVLIEPLLYRHLVVMNQRQATKMLVAIERRSKLASFAHRLHVAADSSLLGSRFSPVHSLLMKMDKLRRLIVESPLVNSSGFESTDKWREMAEALFQPFVAASIGSQLSPQPLQELTSLTLHLNGAQSPYWKLNRLTIPIFKHPALQHIHVSCMNVIDEDGWETEETFFTPLKHLVLEECNITACALAALLRFPKALESLYLGENCYNYLQFRYDVLPNANSIFAVTPEPAMKALKQQAHSLKSLTYATDDQFIFFPGNYSQQNVLKVSFEQGGFEDFHLLEKIHLIGESQNFANAVLNYRSPLSLRELIFEQTPILLPGGPPPARAEFIPRTVFLDVSSPSVPPNLKQMTMVHDMNKVEEGEEWERSTARRNILATETAVREKFGLALSVKYKNRGRYYPPFLYGETLPLEELVYDGTAGGFTEAFEAWARVSSGSR